MRITCWNVNSLKARLGHVLDYCRSGQTDCLLLQELKLTDEAFPHDEFAAIGWNSACHGQKTYNGVAILSPQDISDISRNLPCLIEEDEAAEQARYIEATVKGVRVGALYLPNGNPCPGPKFDYKLAWMRRLQARAEALLATETPVVLAGDYNVMPQKIDCYDPTAWTGDALWHPDSRAAFSACSIWVIQTPSVPFTRMGPNTATGIIRPGPGNVITASGSTICCYPPKPLAVWLMPGWTKPRAAWNGHLITPLSGWN